MKYNLYRFKFNLLKLHFCVCVRMHVHGVHTHGSLKIILWSFFATSGGWVQCVPGFSVFLVDQAGLDLISDQPACVCATTLSSFHLYLGSEDYPIVRLAQQYVILIWAILLGPINYYSYVWRPGVPSTVCVSIV